MRGQFFIIASVIIILELMMLNQFFKQMDLQPAEAPLQEADFSDNFIHIVDNVLSVPPYLLKKNLEVLETSLTDQTSMNFQLRFTCLDRYKCSEINTANFTTYVPATVRLQSENFRLVYQRNFTFTKEVTGLEIVINNGKEKTANPDVVLGLSAKGADECQLSNDGSSWSAWLPYIEYTAWTLESGADGTKTVYYRCRDSTGKIGQTVSDSIELDRTPPAIQLSILEAPVSTVPFITLNVTLTSGWVEQCHFNTDGGDWSDWELYTQYSSYGPIADGNHDITAECKNDNPDDGADSDDATAQISVDTVGPGTTSLLILGKSGNFINETSVKVRLSVSEGNVKCQLQNDTMGWTAKMSTAAPSEDKDWTLPSLQGTRLVYGRCYDQYDNPGGVMSDQVGLDLSAPYGLQIVINGGADYTSNPTVALTTLYAKDDISGVIDCRYQNDALGWTGWSGYVTAIGTWTIPSSVGPHTVSYQCRDLFKKESAVASDTITISDKPVLDLFMVEESPYTTTTSVVLRTNSTVCQYTSDICNCRFNDTVTSWSNPTGHPTNGNPLRKPWTLPAGEGLKQVWGKCCKLSTGCDEDSDWGPIATNFTTIDNTAPTSTPDAIYNTATSAIACDADAAGDLPASPACNIKRSDHPTLTINGTASDLNAVAEVWVSTDDGVIYNQATGTAVWSYSWGNPANGDHKIWTKAKDGAGNWESPNYAGKITRST